MLNTAGEFTSYYTLNCKVNLEGICVKAVKQGNMKQTAHAENRGLTHHGKASISGLCLHVLCSYVVKFFFPVVVAKRNTNDRRIDATGQNSCYMIRHSKTLADIIFASVLVSVYGKFPFRSKKSRLSRRRPRRRCDVFSTVTPLMPSPSLWRL